MNTHPSPAVAEQPVQKPEVGQSVLFTHSSFEPKFLRAVIVAITDTPVVDGKGFKVTLKSDIGEGDGNWFPTAEIDRTIKPYGQVWCYPVPTHRVCKHCDHFVEANDFHGKEVTVLSDTTVSVDGQTFARFVHLEDGEQEFDHDAEPCSDAARPGIFTTYPDDSVGPNSSYHSQRGKRNSHLYEDGEVLYLNSDGYVVQWESDGDHSGPYTSSETLEMYGENNLSEIERSRVGLPPVERVVVI